MREIKFRAWDKDESLMTYLDLGNKNPDVSRLHIALLSDHLREPWGEVMQFTGLHDSQGKEIFEGDIVKILERDWPSQLDSFPELTHEQYLEKLTSTARVIFDDGCFKLSPISTKHCYYSDYAGHTNRRDIFEIIGNIYENPELIAGTQKGLENEGQKNCK